MSDQFKEIELQDSTGKKKNYLKKYNPAKYDQIAMNESFVSVEIYNPMKETIFFDTMIEEEKNFPNAHLKVLPDSFILLPHQLYTAWTKSGSPITVIKNFGKTKFKGNKKPSNPHIGVE